MSDKACVIPAYSRLDSEPSVVETGLSAAPCVPQLLAPVPPHINRRWTIVHVALDVRIVIFVTYIYITMCNIGDFVSAWH